MSLYRAIAFMLICTLSLTSWADDAENHPRNQTGDFSWLTLKNTLAVGGATYLIYNGRQQYLKKHRHRRAAEGFQKRGEQKCECSQNSLVKVTCPLRHIQVLNHVFKEGKKTRRQGQTAYLFGPGLYEFGGVFSVPAAHEFQEALGEAQLVVVELSDQVIATLARSLYPRAIATDIVDNVQNLGEQPQDFQWLRSLIDEMSGRLRDGLRTIRADFATMNMEPRSADVIVAMLSLIYAINMDLETFQAQNLALIKKFLQALKKSGIIYVDANLFKIIKIYIDSLRVGKLTGNYFAPYDISQANGAFSLGDDQFEFERLPRLSPNIVSKFETASAIDAFAIRRVN